MDVLIKKNCVRAAVMLAWSVAAAAAQAAVPYAVTVLNVPNAAESAAWGINNRGAIVGDWVSNDANTWDRHGFVFQGGAFANLSGPAGAVGSAALGISDAGVVVGSYYTTHVTDQFGGEAAGPSSGFIYAAGSYTSLQVPGAKETTPRGISPDGRYVAGSFLSSADGAMQGFVYDRTAQSFTTLGGDLVIAHGVSSSGLVVGSEKVLNADGSGLTRIEGFIYDLATGQRSQYLFDPGVALNATAFRGINADGTLAGYVVGQPIGDAYQVAFVGKPGDYSTFAVAGGQSTVAEGINDFGVVVGNYTTMNGDTFAILAMPVPEPASWLLMAAGGALVAGGTTRRRTKS